MGFDLKDRDGLFISRKNDPIKVTDKINLEIQSQILLSRLFLGETNSYIKNGSKATSPKVLTKTNSYSIKYDGPKKSTIERIKEFVK